jgi:hypothetical protein
MLNSSDIPEGILNLIPYAKIMKDGELFPATVANYN